MKEIVLNYKSVMKGDTGKWIGKPFKIHLTPKSAPSRVKYYIIPHG